MADHLHGEPLLRGLTEVAVEVGRARTVNDVFAAAGAGLDRLGLKLTVMQFIGDSVTVRFFQPPTTEVGRSFTRPTSGPGATLVRRLFDGEEPLFFDEVGALLERHAARDGLSLPPEMLGAARSAGYLRGVLAPLDVAGVRWGGLSVTGDWLEAADLPALTLFSAQLRSALETVETIEGLRRRTRELEAVHAIATGARGSTALLKTVAQAVDADAATLHRYDAERHEFSLVGEPYGYTGPLVEAWQRFKPTEPFSHRTRTGESLAEGLASVKPEGFEVLATVALFLEGKPIGLLSLARRKAAPFAKEDLASAEILGVQVAALLERERLHEEGARQLRQLSLLYELSSASAMQGDVRTLIQKVLQQMLDAFPADIAALHYLEGKQLHLAGWESRQGVMPEGPPTPEYLPLDDTSVIGLAALERKSLALGKGAFPSFTQAASEQMGFHHLMAAPMTVSSREVGTLSVVRAKDAPFTLEHLRLAESCATHIAVILEHARLFEDLRKSYDELAHAQAEVVRHERLAALGELAAVMAHEVRNPLGVIFNSLTSLKRMLKPSGELEMLLSIVQEEAERLNRIVGDLLDFARPYEPVRTLVELEPLIESALQAAVQSAHMPSVKVESAYPQPLPLFQVDGHLLRQAVLNLALNGIQAMPRGGRLSVRASAVERGGDLWARIEVTDEGGGLPKDAADRLFQPFFTTKARGTGLGLAVVKRIVDAHHGEVRAESGEKGTTFVLLIPGGQPRVDDDEGDDDTLPPQLA